MIVVFFPLSSFLSLLPSQPSLIARAAASITWIRLWHIRDDAPLLGTDS